RQGVGTGAVLGEEDLEQLLELEHRSCARLAEPGSEGAASVGRDGVDRAGAPAHPLSGGAGQVVGDQLLRLLVELALGPWPDAPERAVHLLRKLVGGPGLD